MIPAVAGLVSLTLTTPWLVEARALLGTGLKIVCLSPLFYGRHDQGLKLFGKGIHSERILEFPLLHLLWLEIRIVLAHFIHELEADRIRVIPRKIQARLKKAYENGGVVVVSFLFQS
jgi:hypothetical protein